ncbi:MAG: hypothetical protein ACOYNR_16545 [Blastocatellia bacterium]
MTSEYIPNPAEDPVGFVARFEQYGGGGATGGSGTASSCLGRIIDKELWRQPRPGHQTGFATFADWVHGYLRWLEGRMAVEAILKSRYRSFPSLMSQFMRAYDASLPKDDPARDPEGVKALRELAAKSSAAAIREFLKEMRSEGWE